MALTCTNHTDVQDGIDRCARCQNYFCTDCLVSLQGQRLCAVCKEIEREPLNRYMGLRLAGIPTRAFAFVIDMCIIGIVSQTVYRVVGDLDSYFLMYSRNQVLAYTMPVLIGVSSPSFLLYLVLPLVFSLVLEAALLQWRSQSVGKMLIRIKVVGRNGQRVTPAEAWRRATARYAFAIFGILSYIDYLAVFVGKDKATLHDRIAATRVVRE